MTIAELMRELRRLVEEQPRRADQPYREEVRQAGVAYALACREAGYTWSRLAADVPLSSTTLAKWVLASKGETAKTTSLVPVEVVPSRAPILASSGGEEEYGPVLLSPTGYRLFGLTVEQAVAAFRALG